MRSSENTGTRDGKVLSRARFGDALEAAPAHRRVELLAPVVEVAGHQHLAGRHVGGDEGGQALDPAHAAGVHQPEVRDDRVHALAVPVHRHVQRPRCSKRWSETSWWPMSPIGQRDSSALPCSPCLVTALVR